MDLDRIEGLEKTILRKIVKLSLILQKDPKYL